MIIALVNSKGGVGKSTLAGNLVGWLHEHGKSVILADADTQQSSTEWILEALPEIPVSRLSSAEEVFEELPGLAKEAEYIVCDGPGSQTETSRAPHVGRPRHPAVQGQHVRGPGLDKNTTFVRHAQQIRKGPPEAVAVLSMIGRDYRLTKDMEQAAKTFGLRLPPQSITLRQAYASAPARPPSSGDMGYAARDAAEEIDSLFTDLLPEAVGDKVVVMRKGKGREFSSTRNRRQKTWPNVAHSQHRFQPRPTPTRTRSETSCSKDPPRPSSRLRSGRNRPSVWCRQASHDNRWNPGCQTHARCPPPEPRNAG